MVCLLVSTIVTVVAGHTATSTPVALLSIVYTAPVIVVIVLLLAVLTLPLLLLLLVLVMGAHVPVRTLQLKKYTSVKNK